MAASAPDGGGGVRPAVAVVVASLMLVAGLLVGRWTAPGEPAERVAVGDRAGGEERPEAPGAGLAGKWRIARTPTPGRSADVDPAQQAAALDPALLTNPYLQGYRPARPDGQPTVGIHDPSRAQPGLNLYVSGHAPEALLVDMEGRLLHRWRYELSAVWPELYEEHGPELAKLEYWRRAHLLPDGSLLAIFEGLGLVRLDLDSKLIWAFRGGCHHDLEVLDDGSIAVLDRRSVRLPRINPEENVLEDLITILSPDGELRRQVSILEALERSPYRPTLASMKRQGDILHTNTLELIGPDAPSDVPGLAPGHWLLSILELDLVAALDLEAEEVVWALGGLWHRQHQPTLVDGGRLLVFDNIGLGDRSRALEIEPASQRVVWSYPDPPSRDALFSKTLGSVQRLSNGNTLITESENGRALEVTPEGDTVWEFTSPHRAGEVAELVATLFEVLRIEERPAWLAPPGATAQGADDRAGRDVE